jgi:hypothetical protein
VFNSICGSVARFRKSQVGDIRGSRTILLRIKVFGVMVFFRRVVEVFRRHGFFEMSGTTCRRTERHSQEDLDCRGNFSLFSEGRSRNGVHVHLK